LLERPIGTVIAGYRVDEIVGRGGMGVVYRAMDILLERPVALKLIAPELAQDPSFRIRFTRELKFVASIDHPNVIPVHHAGDEDGVLFIAMRYVRGTDLRALIQHDGALPPERAAAIVAQVAGGLQAAHALGLVHRDVKPANVLIADPAGVDHVYLTDFGLSKHATSAPGLTRTGQFVGTVDYVAPEQIRGEGVDERVDIYALGCVLYHALTGQPPFPRESDAAKLWAHMYDAAPSAREINPNVPSGFDEVLRRALDKDPAARFQSAPELCQAATAALQPAREGTRPGGLTAPASHDADADASSGEAPATGVVPPSRPIPDTPPTLQTPQAPAAGSARPPPPAPPPGGPPAAVPADGPSPRPQLRSPRIIFAIAAFAVVVIAVVAVLLARGGDNDGSASKLAPVPAATKLPADLAWRPVDKLTFRRQYAASTDVDGKILLFGGIRLTTSTTATNFYDPATNRWSPGPGLPKALHHLAAVNYNGKPVVIGGFVPGEDLTSGQTNDVWVLRDGDWQRLPSLRHARAAAAAAVVGGKIVVVGGQADGKLVPQTEVYDGKRWTDAKEIPTPREHLGAASDGTYVYAVGGADSSGANSAAVERYDPARDSWIQLDDMPEALKGPGVAYAGGRIVTVGGEGKTTVSDAVYGYDIRGREWSPLPVLPSPRHGVAVTAVKDSLYAMGGATAPGHEGSTNDVELLDVSGKAATKLPVNVNEWRRVATAPSNVQYAATTDLGGRIWLFGGIGKDELGTRDSVGYDPVVGSWITGAPLPRPVDHAAAVVYGGEPVVIGGFLGRGRQQSGASDRVFALHGDKWVPRPRLNHARWGAAAAVVGDKIVVVGGQANDRLVPETEIYDGDHWTTAKPIPTPRDHLGAASDDRYVYAVGGRRLGPDANVGALERYDPETDRWTKLDPMPKITGAVSTAYVNPLVVAVGGEGPTTVSDAVQAYDVRRQAWSTPLPNLPEPRHGAGVTALRDSLFAIGGTASAGHVDSTRDVYVLKFK